MKEYSELTGQEMLALAIALEEEASRGYGDLAERMRESDRGTARLLASMAEQGNGHHHRLLDLYRSKFGDQIPLIRLQDVKGFPEPDRSGCASGRAREAARKYPVTSRPR